MDANGMVRLLQSLLRRNSSPDIDLHELVFDVANLTGVNCRFYDYQGADFESNARSLATLPFRSSGLYALDYLCFSLVMMFMIRPVIHLLPFAFMGIVFYFTGSELYAGITFTVSWLAYAIWNAKKYEQRPIEEDFGVTSEGVRRQKWFLRIFISIVWLSFCFQLDRYFPNYPKFLDWLFVPFLAVIGIWGEKIETSHSQGIAEKQLKTLGPNIAKDLTDLLENKLPANAMRSKLGGLPGEVQMLLCELSHYLSDGDIRKKDPTYAEMQDRELRKLIELLKSGGSAKEIEKINFLRSS